MLKIFEQAKYGSKNVLRKQGLTKNKSIKVLIFVKAFYKVGGIETMTMILAKDLEKMGHEVKIITYKPSEVDFGRIDAYSAPRAFKKLYLYWWCDTFYMPEIALEGVWLRLFNPLKKWVVSHNSYYLEKNGLFASTKRLLIRSASNISASKSIAKGLGTKSKVIRCCYNNSIFKLYETEKRSYDFVFAGRLVAYKGCEMLIKACAKLGRPFTLTVIGDGEERPKLEALTKELGLSKYIQFTVYLQGEELARMLNRHKVMVLPNIEKEGFGIVALEGMACGCRMITANAGGLCEAVDKFGHTFPMGDEAELIRLMWLELDGAPAINYNPLELTNYLANHFPSVAVENYLSFFRKDDIKY